MCTLFFAARVSVFFWHNIVYYWSKYLTEVCIIHFTNHIETDVRKAWFLLINVESQEQLSFKQLLQDLRV